VKKKNEGIPSPYHTLSWEEGRLQRLHLKEIQKVERVEGGARQQKKKTKRGDAAAVADTKKKQSQSNAQFSKKELQEIRNGKIGQPRGCRGDY